MAKIDNFNPENLLSSYIAGLTRRQVRDLGLRLCAELTPFLGEGECHGGVRPDNISLDGQEVSLGPALEGTDMGPSELEYLAPERFWSGAKGPAGDVYSLGLVLYAALNGGRLPFWPEQGTPTMEERANSLRRRMQGELPPIPPAAGAKLGAVLEKALSFSVEDRYRSAAELAEALRTCPENEPALPLPLPKTEKPGHEVKAAAPAAAGSAPEAAPKPDKPAPAAPEPPAAAAKAPEAAPTAPRKQYTVDKHFEQPEPPRKKKSRTGVIIALVIAVIAIVALILILGDNGAPADPAVTPTETVDPSPTGTDEAVDPTEVPEVSPSPDVTPDASPDATPDTTPDATPSPSYEVPGDIVRYELVFADYSWEMAAAACEEMGGHLATVSDQAELDEIIAVAEEAGASLVWLGAYRAAGDQWTWVTGEEIEFYPWADGEPSYYDTDGTEENFLLLWNVSFGGQSGWRYNDCRDNPAAAYPSRFSGQLAFVCEYEY